MATTTIQLLTYSIVGIIAVITAFALLSRNHRFVASAPPLLTSLGIFGTFLGITIGLAGFEPDHVRASVPVLFRGIQLAFWTSVAGILGGILVRLRVLFWPPLETGPGARETFTDMVGALRGVEASLTDAKGSPLLSSLEKLVGETREQATTTHRALNALLSAPGVSGASDEALISKLETLSDSSARGLQDLQKQSDAGLKALSEESSERFDQLTKQLGISQEEILNRLEAAMLDELRGLHADSNERLEKLNAVMDKVYNALPGSEYSSGLLSRMDALRDSSQELGERMSQALAQAFQASHESLGAEVTRVAAEMRDALAGSKDVAAEIGQSLQKGQADLAKAVSADLGELTRQLAAGSAQAANQAHELNAIVGGLKGGLSKDITGLVDRLEKSQAELSDELSATLVKASDSARSALQTDLSALHKQLSAGSEQAARQTRDLTEALATLRAGLGEDSAALLERLDHLRENSAALGEGMREAARASTDALREGLEAGRDAMAAQITKAVTDLRDDLVGPEGAAAQIAGRMDEMQQTLAETFASTGTALQAAAGADSAALLDRIDALNEGLGQMAEAVSSSVGEVGGGLSGDFKTLAGNLTDALDDLRISLAGPEGAVAALGDTLSQGQNELATTMEKTTAELREMFGSDSAALKEMLGADAAAMRKSLATVMQQATGELAAAVAADSEMLKVALSEDAAGMREALVAFREQTAADNAALQATIAKDALTLQKAVAKSTSDLQKVFGKDLVNLQKALGKDAASSSKQMAALDKSVAALNKSIDAAVGKSKAGLAGDIQAVGEQVLGGIGDLTRAITGPKGATAGLAEEIRKSQKATAGELASIRSALEENTQRQIDYSPKKLLEVLEEMIRQFNTQFAGQFWDKLGGFGDAVAELIEWMETYRKQIDDMLGQQTRSAKNMDIAARRFDDIASKSEIFIDVSKNIATMLGGLDSQRVQIESHLKRFAHIVDETSTNLQNIEEKIVAGNNDMNKHIAEITKRIEDQIIRVDRGMEDELTKALNTFGQQLTALSEKFVDDYGPLTERLREVVSIARGA